MVARRGLLDVLIELTPCTGAAEMKEVPAGTGTEAMTFVAAKGPLLVTT